MKHLLDERVRSPEEWLKEEVVSVVAWASRVVEHAQGDSALWTPDSSEAIRPLEKMLIEGALLAYIADRAVGDHPAVTALLEAISRRTEALNRIYELVRWRPHLWTSIGLVWVILDRFSMGDPEKRRRLRAVWANDTVQPHERAPYRLLDQAWVRTITRGSRDSLIESREFLSCTALGNIRGALFMNISDLYAVTHSAMYLTDFGTQPGPQIESGWVGPLSLSRLLVGDFDLAGELALTDCLVSPDGMDVGSTVSAAALSSMFHALGYVPSPSLRADCHELSDAPDDYVTYHSYHSTFVYGLLCAVVRTKTPRSGVVTAMRAAPGRLPAEWDLRRVSGAELGARVAHTFDRWRTLLPQNASEDRTLLRATLDAYLVDAAANANVDEQLALLGMATVAGPSRLDQSTRELLNTRALLTGGSSLSALLPGGAGLCDLQN